MYLDQMLRGTAKKTTRVDTRIKAVNGGEGLLEVARVFFEHECEEQS